MKLYFRKIYKKKSLVINQLKLEILQEQLGENYQKKGDNYIWRCPLCEAKGADNHYENLFFNQNNENFDNFMTTAHARMRFLTRNILIDTKNHNKQIKTLNKLLEENINNLKTDILNQTYYKIYNYINQESGKNGIRIRTSNVTLGLTPQGGIHTIYYNETL